MVQLDVRKPIVIARSKHGSAPSSLSIIEAAYDLDAEDELWLAALVRTLQPFVDSGLGLCGHFYDLADGSLRADTVVFLPCEALFEALAAATSRLPAESVQAYYTTSPCRSLSQVHSDLGIDHRALEASRLLEREVGVADVLFINAWRGNHSGCCFAAPVARVSRFPARAANMLSRAARHIAAAQRLRRSLRRRNGRVSLDVDAVLDQRGAVLHAEGKATGKREREGLAAAVRKLTGAQQRFRETDPEQVTSIWSSLVDGRWSLVDSFDSDGKRFLLAHRNALELPEPSALTPAERQVAALFARGHSSKLVAYELGLSPSAVSSTLRRALRKLRLKSRTELVALFNTK